MYIHVDRYRVNPNGLADWSKRGASPLTDTYRYICIYIYTYIYIYIERERDREIDR